MKLFKFLSLIALPFAVLTTPLAAQADDAEQARDAADQQMENTVLAGNTRDGKKDDEDKDKDGKDGKKDGKEKSGY